MSDPAQEEAELTRMVHEWLLDSRPFAALSLSEQLDMLGWQVIDVPVAAQGGARPFVALSPTGNLIQIVVRLE